MTSTPRTFSAASEAEREALAAVPRRLVGRRLVDVRYFEIHYGSPRWRCEGFHALDYGLELDVDGPAETWSATWKMAGEVEALLVYPGPLVGVELVADGEYGRWDVAGEQPWAAMVGQVITGAELAEWDEYEGVSAPGALRLVSGGGEAVLVLGTCDGDGHFRSSPDDVAVFPSLEAARAHGAIGS